MIIKLKKVRLAFPDLFKARAFDEGHEPKFGASFLLSKDDPQVQEIRKAIQAVAREKWGVKADAIVKGINPDKICLRDGDSKAAKYDGYEGCMYLAAKSKTKPGVFDNVKDPTTGKWAELTQEDGKPYAGCYVDASVDIYAYQHAKGGSQVNASLRAVKFAADGDAFTGSAPADAAEFDDVADTGDDLDGMI